MILKPEELNFDDKKLFIIIAGVPGIGKTTLALSAPKPLLIDLDKGISRVEAKYRKDTLIASSLSEVEEALKNNDLSDYETLVLDTGGSAFDLLKCEIIASNPKARQSDGSLSLKGYGIAKTRYMDFVKFLRSLDKHLVIVFHATEVTLDEDIKLTGYRIRIEGASRNEVWDDVDLGGFMETRGNKRTISFASCDRFYAKGTHGVHGVYDIPTLDGRASNNFLTKLINKVHSDYQSESEEYANYLKAMSFAKWIEQAKTPEDLEKCEQAFLNLKHALTSKIELQALLDAKKKGLNNGNNS